MQEKVTYNLGNGWGFKVGSTVRIQAAAMGVLNPTHATADGVLYALVPTGTTGEFTLATA